MLALFGLFLGSEPPIGDFGGGLRRFVSAAVGFVSSGCWVGAAPSLGLPVWGCLMGGHLLSPLFCSGSPLPPGHPGQEGRHHGGERDHLRRRAREPQERHRAARGGQVGAGGCGSSAEAAALSPLRGEQTLGFLSAVPQAAWTLTLSPASCFYFILIFLFVLFIIYIYYYYL